MVPILFQYSGVKIFLSERLCQDPLEKYFGKQRQCGGSNENPNMQQFLDNTAALRIMGSVALDPVRGNIKADKRSLTVDENPLPKRRKIRKDQISKKK